MKEITIGNLIFTKKAILRIAFILFIIGIFTGAFVALNIKTGGEFNFPLLLICSIPILISLSRKLKGEIKKKY